MFLLIIELIYETFAWFSNLFEDILVDVVECV